MDIKEGTLSSENSSTDATPALKPAPGRKRSMVVFAISSLLSIALLVLLWSQLVTPANQANSTSTTPESNGSIGELTYNGPLLGKSAPDFTLQTLTKTGIQQTPVHLAAYKGKPVVLNIWASWCGPCQSEASRMQSTWLHVQSQGVVFLGVNGEDREDTARDFLSKYAITYANASDPKGKVAIDYGLTYMPQTVFINRDGKIVQVVPGEISQQTLDQAIQKLLA